MLLNLKTKYWCIRGCVLKIPNNWNSSYEWRIQWNSTNTVVTVCCAYTRLQNCSAGSTRWKSGLCWTKWCTSQLWLVLNVRAKITSTGKKNVDIFSFLFLLFNQETLLRNQTLRLWSYNKFNASGTERWVLQIQIWNVVLTIILNVLKKMQEELVWTGQFNSILVLCSTKKSLWQPVE